MKKTLITAFFSLLLAAASSAATIAVGRGGPTNGYTVYSHGTYLSEIGGFYIAIGTFATEPVITSPTFYQALVDFRVFASVLSPTSGTTKGSITGSFVGTDASFNNAPLYFLIGNGTTKENSTAFIFLKGDPLGFTFPATAGQPSGSGTVTLTGADVASVLDPYGYQTEVAGAPDLLVMSFPEPSSVMFGLLGLASLMRRRR